MSLIYLAPVRWDSYPQRSHKFVEWFHSATGRDVLWIEPYATRFPSLRDVGLLYRRPDAAVSTESPPWLRRLQVPSLAIEPLPYSGAINGIVWKRALREVQRFANTRRSLLGIGKPSVFALQLLASIQPEFSFYDAMDNFPAFYSGISKLTAQRRERKLADAVDRILASSTNLFHRWRRVTSDVRSVPNGLDAAELPDVAGHRSSGGRLVFGYVGTIGRWFDWDWVNALARARPDVTIKLIGPAYVLPGRPIPGNVQLLPACDHGRALREMSEFRVGLIPFVRSDLTDAVDPIKYYEYRALGLPVISTRFGEMARRVGTPGVFISDGAQDIPGNIEAAMGYIPDAEEIRDFRRRNTWEMRFSLSGIV